MYCDKKLYKFQPHQTRDINSAAGTILLILTFFNLLNKTKVEKHVVNLKWRESKHQPAPFWSSMDVPKVKVWLEPTKIELSNALIHLNNCDAM